MIILLCMATLLALQSWLEADNLRISLFWSAIAAVLLYLMIFNLTP